MDDEPLSDPSYATFFSRVARQWRAERDLRNPPGGKPSRAQAKDGDGRAGPLIASAAELAGIAERCDIDILGLVEAAQERDPGLARHIPADWRRIDLPLLIAEHGALAAQLIRLSDAYGRAHGGKGAA